jgi:predicted transcriptional regulator
MKLPCQMIVWNVFPAIRDGITEELSFMGISQLEVAHLLDMTPSAISQYHTGKRGCRNRI